MKKFIKRICITQGSFGLFFLRIVIGIIFFKAGTGKLFAWYDGPGIEKVIGFFTQMGIPAPQFNAYLVGGVEAVGGLALIVGLFTRLFSIPLAITMIVAMLTAHKPNLTEPIPMAFYYVLVIFAACVALLDRGAGRLSIDRRIGHMKD